MKESPLFAKGYDFIRWLIPQTVKFPRGQRFVVAARLQQSALDFMETLYSAGASEHPLSTLRQADALLKTIRFYLRLSHDLELLSTGRYEHASRQVDELGRLLGAWIRKTAA